MRRHEVEKASFRLGVAEGLQCVDMDRGDAHGTMIRAAFSDSSSAGQGPAGRTLVGKPTSRPAGYHAATRNNAEYLTKWEGSGEPREKRARVPSIY
jgi:hypothetical protein